MSKTLIYAELLSNIRQTSIIAVLDTPCDASTNVELAEDGKQVTLRHHGVRTALDLPGQVALSSRLQRPVIGSQELSWRLPLAGPQSRPDPDNSTSNEAPWPARDLTAANEFCCRVCGAETMKKGVVKEWKDLPSENWAEMMDFWHCHKPDIPESNGHSHDDPNANKAYGANARFTARSGVGFVDLTSFLVDTSDCSEAEIEKAADQESKYTAIVCSKCQNYVGHVDHQASGYRLYKWRLLSPTKISGPSSCHEPSLSSIITAQLQSIMSAQCCSRLVLLPTNWTPSSPTPMPATFISMWILSPSIRYSSTAQQASMGSRRGTLAMKIFWNSVDAVEANKLLDSSTHEEVLLPTETIVEIEEALNNSSLFLPPNGRTFQGWNVGLLERFDQAKRS